MPGSFRSAEDDGGLPAASYRRHGEAYCGCRTRDEMSPCMQCIWFYAEDRNRDAGDAAAAAFDA